MNPKIPSGCAGLDEILRGGIPANTITVLMGAPGTGKTILAEQFAFANAAPDAPALYLTTLSEPLEKFIVHGQTHTYFDQTKVGTSIFYEDLGLIVREQGIDQLAEIVTRLLLERRPRFLFIDSLKALLELFQDRRSSRTAVYDLASVLSAYQCTTFLVGEYAENQLTELPEFAIADAVLQMLKYSSNVREERFLRVEKLRGSGFVPGMHALSITDDGIEVFPRLLTPATAPDYRARVERVKTGISGLDELIAEGFWRGSTTLVAGPTGAGKTIIGLHFLTAGAQMGDKGLYVGFQENPTQLSRLMTTFGWDPEKLMNDGFELIYTSPVEMKLDQIATQILRRVKAGDTKRVVIDALGDLKRTSVDLQRFSDFIYAITQWFAARNITCLLMSELPLLFELHGISDEEVSNMSDNVILLQFKPEKELLRTLRIIKTRGSAHDASAHELQITNKGVVVKPLRK